MIVIEKLTKSYGTKHVLTNINLTFLEGKVYGIVGENGAGKTTLFRCIAGLEEYQGAIKASVEPLKNHLGLLLTEQYFFSKITGEEYLKLLCNARENKNVNIASNNIFELPLNQYVSTYSTGMKKKLAITAILLQKNEYFILDEPFNGVDIQSNIILTEIIHKLKDLNKIVILSSHIFSTLSVTCDEIHWIGNGEIIKTVNKDSFSELESKMKEIIVRNKLEKLDIE